MALLIRLAGLLLPLGLIQQGLVLLRALGGDQLGQVQVLYCRTPDLPKSNHRLKKSSWSGSIFGMLFIWSVGCLFVCLFGLLVVRLD